MTDATDPCVARPIGLLRPVPGWVSALTLAALLVALAGVVGPFHRCVPRRQANESAAIATLKNIASAQAQLRDRGAIDVDGDGRGEFGFLAELAGAATGRAHIDPPLLSSRFGEVANGRVQRSGYCFRCFLRGRDGEWLAEVAAGGAVGLPVDADAAERDWRVLAWPIVAGSSGTRTFAIDATGEVRGTAPGGRVYGGDRAPAATALDDAGVGWRTIQ